MDRNHIQVALWLGVHRENNPLLFSNLKILSTHGFSVNLNQHITLGTYLLKGNEIELKIKELKDLKMCGNYNFLEVQTARLRMVDNGVFKSVALPLKSELLTDISKNLEDKTQLVVLTLIHHLSLMYLQDENKDSEEEILEDFQNLCWPESIVSSQLSLVYPQNGDWKEKNSWVYLEI